MPEAVACAPRSGSSRLSLRARAAPAPPMARLVVGDRPDRRRHDAPGLPGERGEHGAGQWIAVFYTGRGGHEPVAAAGTAQEPTPWRAVQRAAWEVLNETGA
jgi:hypothetical protein